MLNILLLKIVIYLYLTPVESQETFEQNDNDSGVEARCLGLLSMLFLPKTIIRGLFQGAGGFLDGEGRDDNSRIEIQITEEVCYGDLGCFRLEYPWFVEDSRPIRLLPQDPSTINTHFFLSTRKDHGRRRRVFTLRPELKSDWEDFNAKRLTVVLTHGFNSNAGIHWIRKLETAILSKTDANVISVDWSKGGGGINYMQSASNTRVVAAEISRLLQDLIINANLRPDRVHLIGQSLGAHVMAYVANNITGISRITGLDPAQPGFEGNDPAVYLDASDANFVDIVHTNGDPFVPSGGMGFVKPCGDVDFYVNGGEVQPGCPGVKIKTGPLTLIINTLAELLSTPIAMLVNYASCSHSRAYEYFTEAFSGNCMFWGRKWSINTPVPVDGECSPETCSVMGKFTELFSARGSFYVKTNKRAPYCISHPDIEGRMMEYIKNDNRSRIFDDFLELDEFR